MTESGLAAALGRVPSGIFVLTTKRGEEEGALLGSWVQQASFQPPTISVAVHKDRPIDRHLKEHASFALNILSKEEKVLYAHFVKNGGVGPNLFKDIETEILASGSPALSKALAALDCRVRSRLDVGDHHLVIADVLDGKMLGGGDPRVHIRKNGLSY